jgi:homoserine kinase
VFGANELLGTPFTTEELLPYAMVGEQAASGSFHADNIAPALLGGFTLIKGYDPLEIKHIPYPEDLVCALVHPDLEFRTSEGRKMLPGSVPMKTALAQAGNLAGLIAGLTTSDYGLIKRSIFDHFAEPYRTKQLPAFEKLREKAIGAGALGCGLSGSGPSIFALCRSHEIAGLVADVVKDHFGQHHISCDTYVSRVSEAGCRITG